MKIILITPSAVGSRTGNRNTACRWAGFLRQLGHRVDIQVEWDGAPADLMLALHARRSHESMRRFAETFLCRPIILALTGTDLYRDIRHDAAAQQSMQLATRMIVLQERGLLELEPELRAKTRVIYQSAPPARPQPKLKTRFQACVIGHLREEKDPFRCTYALRYLPSGSRIWVIHLGGALSPSMAEEAHALMQEDQRYHWLGNRPHGQAMRKLACSHVMVISSRMEGGANVICEALAAGVPVIASDIAGNIGMLGADYPGYYPCGDEQALARLLWRAESEPVFYAQLQAQCAARRPLFTPEQERAGLESLLAEL
ncbi:MAG: selenoneine biosynthesis selenosugar synthase SenB [Sulfurimicrobium sp.]|nr:selenoneine biosynthesis selenosugar synthase SenB [Sulfurimicrobium sp.]